MNPLYRLGAGGLPEQTLRKADSELVQWLFGPNAATEAALALMGRLPMEMEARAARKRLRDASRLHPVKAIACLEGEERGKCRPSSSLSGKRGRPG